MVPDGNLPRDTKFNLILQLKTLVYGTFPVFAYLIEYSVNVLA